MCYSVVSGVIGVSGPSIPMWTGDNILADWAIGPVGRVPCKETLNGCLNVQQCFEGLGECYGMFTIPMRHSKLTAYFGDLLEVNLS